VSSLQVFRPKFCMHFSSASKPWHQMEVSGPLHAVAALTPRIGPFTQLIREWVGPIAGLDAAKKRKIPCTCRESNPLPSSP
jgi:hypothetical protein